MREVLREHVTVDGPVRVAWDHLPQLEQWPTWAGHIRRMDPTPPGRLTESNRVLLHMRAGPRTLMTVTDYDPPCRWVWEGRSFMTLTRFEHPLRAPRRRPKRGSGSGPGWAVPSQARAGWMFGRMMRRYLARALPKLKAETEATMG